MSTAPEQHGSQAPAPAPHAPHAPIATGPTAGAPALGGTATATLPPGSAFAPPHSTYPPSGVPTGAGSPGGPDLPDHVFGSGRAPEPRQRRSRWVPMAATATAAALLASLATAGLTGAFTPEDAATTPSVATLGQQESSTVPVSGSTADQPDWEAVAAAVRPSVVAIDVRTAAGEGKGSGVLLDSKGNILTNDHVVGDAADGGLQVTLADGRVFEATLVGTDPATDLAVIRLVDPPKDLSPAVLGDSDDVAVGEAVMAVGNPLGLDSTATTGIVSALDRPVSTSDGQSETVVTNAIQIDAAVNPGNSGGPLFDASGEVIGITSSIASLSNGSSAGSIGLGFAIPSNLADRIAAELLADGSAEHAFLGVSLSDGTATADGTTRRGAVVEQVTTGSPAAEAELQTGDVIVAVGSDPVNGAESLTAFVRELAAGQEVTLTVVRDGRPTEVHVTLATREDSPSQG